MSAPGWRSTSFIKELCEAGAAILLISSDLPEILHLTHRVYVMYRGTLRAELTGDGDHPGDGARPLLRARGGLMSRRRAEPEASRRQRSPRALDCKLAFVRLGVLPFLLADRGRGLHAAVGQFPHQRNLLNVARQSTYLTMVSMGQMFALLTGGFDLSVGTTLAVTSVVGATGHGGGATRPCPTAVALAIALGLLAGFGAGLSIGIVNGIGVALFNVSPFMMTLGMASIGFGIALYLTGGVPVYGMPPEFGDIFGFGSWLGIPAPVYVTVALIVLLYLLVNWTRLGRYFYAVGGNIKAARLSGINTRLTLFIAYVLCGGMASIAGLLLTARLETGEANIGASMPLESIAACVIAGVSLRGGVGRVENVVLGALFIGLIQNGMNLARIEVVPADRRDRRAADPGRGRGPAAAALHGERAGVSGQREQDGLSRSQPGC